MRKLSKAQEQELDRLISELTSTKGEIEGAVDSFNQMMEEVFADLIAPHVEKYNALAEEAGEFVTNIADDMQSYIDDRSENWPETEGGQAYIEWQDVWASINAETVEFDPPEALEPPDLDLVDELEQLPRERNSL